MFNNIEKSVHNEQIVINKIYNTMITIKTNTLIVYNKFDKIKMIIIF